MNKEAFILALGERLSELPWEEVDERLAFYAEMIDDRIEEGLSEEDAVAAVGSVDEIASQIIADIPLSQLVRKKLRPRRRLGAGTVALLVLGSPVWLPLLISAFAIVLSLYVSLWAVVISLWAVVASLLGCTVGGIVSGIIFTLNGNGTAGAAMIGCTLMCAGLSILLFFACKAATKAVAQLAKKTLLAAKKNLMKREAAV